jgi:hypothetical protein
LVGLTNVVETKMCAKDWNSIEFGKIPSLAASRYQKAFGRNATANYNAYKEALSKGEAKINAGAVYPYDVIKGMFAGDVAVSAAQWEALPNFLGDDKIIPMVDVSGSMTCKVGGDGVLSCMDVAVSLGLYIADKQQGAFKDLFLTFSENSKIEHLQGDIISKLHQLKASDWGMSTNFESAFDEILRVAVANKVPQEDMPKYLLTFSDMEFNRCARGTDATALQLAKQKFAAAGYELPKIVFWNLNARQGNVPVRFDQEGTALVSGFSPSILKSILSAKAFSPKDIMLTALMDERYNMFGAQA